MSADGANLKEGDEDDDVNCQAQKKSLVMDVMY